MSLNRFILFFALTFIWIQAVGQDPACSHAMTLEEQQAMAAYLKNYHNNSIRATPTPPPGQVRTMAEWEPIQALILSWTGQPTIQREIVRAAVKECKVIILTTNPDNVSGILTNAGIPLDSVTFLNAPFNTIWVRDYGPWTVYKNDVDSLWIVDWIYNRPRPQDDQVPTVISNYLGLPIYEATQAPMDWIHTGGNHLPDGLGTLFSSNLVLNENPGKSEAQIDSIADVFLGVKQYIKFPTLPFDGIHHLDMHMRVIDEETIFFGQYPEGIADGPQIEANIKYLQEGFSSSLGHAYNILRLPMPPDGNGRYPNQGGSYRTYTNSIFLNKTILVPTYEEKYDTTALRIYRENLPGYNVVGINCNSIIGSLGALHCITKTVGVNQPLWIAHARLKDSDDASREYPVTAIVKHREGVQGVELFYKISTDSTYTMASMVLVDTAASIWGGIIPPFPSGTEVQYYIHATATTGQQQVRPIVAPEGYFRFHIYGEPANIPPSVQITYPPDQSVFNALDTDVHITAEANDADGSISGMQLLINDEIAFTTAEATFDYPWSNPGVGAYELVTLTTDDDGAISHSDTIHVIIEEATATNQLTNNEPCKIYPNPANDVVNLSCDLGLDEFEEISVSNLQGKLLPVRVEGFGQEMQLDISSLSPGVYLVWLRSAKGVSVGKLIKK